MLFWKVQLKPGSSLSCICTIPYKASTIQLFSSKTCTRIVIQRATGLQPVAKAQEAIWPGKESGSMTVKLLAHTFSSMDAKLPGWLMLSKRISTPDWTSALLIAFNTTPLPSLLHSQHHGLRHPPFKLLYQNTEYLKTSRSLWPCIQHAATPCGSRLKYVHQ